MKLWLKISLICTSVLLLVVGLCSTLLVLISKNNMLHLTIDSALTEQASLQSSFQGMIGFYGKDDMSPVAKHALAKYWFSQLASNTSVLIMGDETVYSDISIQPEKIFSFGQTGNQNYYIGTSNGAQILITGGSILVHSDEYQIYTVSDLTQVYNSIDEMVVEFGAVSLVCIVLGMALIVVLVRYAIKPLKTLGQSARRIAKGDYCERAPISNKPDEVGTLAQDFNVMAQAVQSHIDDLNENAHRQQLFIGGLTHEFKTPLTSVIGHSETLLYTKMPEEVVQNSLSHILDECRRLERLTQKMLRLITLEERIELPESSVPDLLESVKNSVAETLSKHNIKLHITCEINTLPMDYDLMQSLLINLIENAAKASSEEQTIELLAQGNTITVADHGAGIPAEEIPRIFEPFYRVDKSRSRKSGGSGLGLALVQRIAMAHGAQITVDSTIGKGTSVNVTFPVYK